MRQVIRVVLPFCVIVMVSPINIIAAILLLFSKKPLLDASCYLGGFVVGLAAVVTGLTALASAVHLDPGNRALESGVGPAHRPRCMVGRRRRPQVPRRAGPDDDAELPGWMDGIAGFGAGRSLAVGAGIGAGNPKNIAVASDAAVAVSSAGLPVGEQVVVLAIYVVLGCLGVAAPIVTMVVLGDRAGQVLDGWKAWLIRNNTAMMAVIFLFFGVFLIGTNLGTV